MCRFIETICIENGRPRHLHYHEKRRNQSLKHAFNSPIPQTLQEIIRQNPPPLHGRYKCRIVYDDRHATVTYEFYMPRSIRTVALAHHDSITYPFKYENRSTLETLAVKYPADDVLIIKNGLVTDASFANVAFCRNNLWHTPESYLLNGTMRQYLLDQGILKAVPITSDDIESFEGMKLINALLGFDAPVIPIKNIFTPKRQ